MELALAPLPPPFLNMVTKWQAFDFKRSIINHGRSLAFHKRHQLWTYLNYKTLATETKTFINLLLDYYKMPYMCPPLKTTWNWYRLKTATMPARILANENTILIH